MRKMITSFTSTPAPFTGNYTCPASCFSSVRRSGGAAGSGKRVMTRSTSVRAAPGGTFSRRTGGRWTRYRRPAQRGPAPRAGFCPGALQYPIRSNTPARGGSGMDCPPCRASRRTPDDTGVAGGLRCGGRRLMEGMHRSLPEVWRSGGLEVFRERYRRRVSGKWCSLRRLGMRGQGWTVVRIPVHGSMASRRGPSGTWLRRSWGHPPSTTVAD